MSTIMKPHRFTYMTTELWNLKIWWTILDYFILYYVINVLTTVWQYGHYIVNFPPYDELYDWYIVTKNAMAGDHIGTCIHTCMYAYIYTYIHVHTYIYVFITYYTSPLHNTHITWIITITRSAAAQWLRRGTLNLQCCSPRRFKSRLLYIFFITPNVL